MISDDFKVVLDIFLAETQGMDIRKLLVLAVIEALLIFVPAFLVRKKKKVRWIRLGLIYLFLVYVGFVLSLTIFRRPEGSREGIVRFVINLGFGIKTGRPSVRLSAYSIFNIVLFVPFGIFAYLALRNKNIIKSIFVTTFVGMLCSLVIELTQLATARGMFEVTDIITNTGGSLIGALIAAFLLHVIQKNSNGVKNEGTNGK